MKNVKVNNMLSPRGNAIPNQFVIITDGGRYFQSYDSIIAFVPYRNGKVILDERYWDCSVTTSKYRNIFLGEGSKETKQKIESGEYLLANLND